MGGVAQLTRAERQAALLTRIAGLDGAASPAIRELLADMVDFAAASPLTAQPPIGPTAITPLWMQNESFQAQADRGLITALWPNGGIISAGDFAVSKRAAGNNMSVDIAPGSACVVGSDIAGQGNYLPRSTAVLNRTVAAGPAAGLTRYDRVILHVYDQAANAAYASNPPWDVEVLTGTALASGAVAPAAPPSSLTLATLGPITSTTTAIGPAWITDQRQVAISASPPLPGPVRVFTYRCTGTEQQITIAVPAGYAHAQLLMEMRTDNAVALQSCPININGHNGATDYAVENHFVNGPTNYASEGLQNTALFADWPYATGANAPGFAVSTADVLIYDYAGPNINHVARMISYIFGATGWPPASATQWSGLRTAIMANYEPINQIQVTIPTANVHFTARSRFDLYMWP